jgi:long-chain alkane monooxygenase
MGLGSRNPAIVGSAEEVADDLIARVEETDIDGFNLSRIVTPESLEDFVDLVVPILQERGAYKRDYCPVPCARSCSDGRGCCRPATRPPPTASPPSAAGNPGEIR